MKAVTRRSSTIPETTFIATTTILLILLIAALVAFIITFFRHIHRPEGVNLPLTPINSRGFSRANGALQQQAPPQSRRSFNARTYTTASLPSSHATTHTSPLPTYRPSPYPPSAPTQTLLRYSPNIPPASLADPKSPDAVRRDALIARLAAMPLTSDTTDDTGLDVPEREVMNRGYADWVARRRPHESDPTAAMLIGSDEGTTDAGGGEVECVGHAALLAKGEGSDTGHGVRSVSDHFAGFDYSSTERQTGGNRAWARFGGTIGTNRTRGSVVEDDEEPLTPSPPPAVLRKIRSDPY